MQQGPFLAVCSLKSVSWQPSLIVYCLLHKGDTYPTWPFFQVCASVSVRHSVCIPIFSCGRGCISEAEMSSVFGSGFLVRIVLGGGASVWSHYLLWPWIRCWETHCVHDTSSNVHRDLRNLHAYGQSHGRWEMGAEGAVAPPADKE